MERRNRRARPRDTTCTSFARHLGSVRASAKVRVEGRAASKVEESRCPCRAHRITGTKTQQGEFCSTVENAESKKPKQIFSIPVQKKFLRLGCTFDLDDDGLRADFFAEHFYFAAFQFHP